MSLWLCVPSGRVSVYIFIKYDRFLNSGLNLSLGLNDVNKRSVGAFLGVSGGVFAPSGHVSFYVFMMCDTSLGSSVNFRLGLNDVIKRSFGGQ